jgi:pimeloyl-ACP methyl ester carboxylesterase/acyl carrier protein
VPGVEAERFADLSELAGAEPVPDVVFVAAPRSGNGLSGPAARGSVQATLDLLQGWLTDDRLAGSRLVFVSRAAVAAAGGDAPDPVAAAVWGLVRSAQAEHPDRFVAVDLEGDAVPVWEQLLVADEPQLAVRGETVYVPRLVRVSVSDDEPVGWDEDGTVLVTGGTGGLGALVARHLVETQGVQRLLLASRRGPDADAARGLVEDLAHLGGEATVVACDVTCRDSVAELLSQVPPEHPVTAVIHTAGVLEDGTIESLTADQVERVMAPKVDGACHLHELVPDAELILFSSVAPLLGGPGQGNYAAANAFLDALAQRRRGEGRAGVSLAWGLWDRSAGMASVLDEAGFMAVARQIRDRLGMLPLSPSQGVGLFDAALSHDAPLVAPVRLDLGGLRAAARSEVLPAILRGLVRAPAQRERNRGSLARRLAGVPEQDWDEIILELVCTRLAAVLGHDSGEAIDPELGFNDLGFDSLAAVDLRNSLSQATGLRLPATLVFDHHTPRAVASHLRQQASQLRTKPADDRGPVDPTDTLSGLLREARRRGMEIDSVPLLMEASRFRASFASPAELAVPPEMLRLATGDRGPHLVCVPSFLAGSGPHQFARLAGHFAGARNVSAFRLPGFRPGDPVPASWEAMIAALASSLRETVAGEPFVLVGYSIGGALAHALARRFEDEGTPPAGVGLLDTYVPSDPQELRALGSQVLAEVIDLDHELMPIDGTNLTALGAYQRLFLEWTPTPIGSPTLLVRTTQPLGDAYAAGRLAWWQLPEAVVEVESDHFGLIEANAEATARTLDNWIDELTGALT